MNIVNPFRTAKQFRCLPLVGKDTSFGYLERSPGETGGNYQPCSGVVVTFTQMNEKGPKEWLKLICTSKIDEESQSMSSDGSQRPDALYTFAKDTIMSASALLSNSSGNLGS